MAKDHFIPLVINGAAKSVMKMPALFGLRAMAFFIWRRAASRQRTTQ